MRAHIFIKTRKTAASRTRAVEIALVRSPYSLSAQHQSSIPILYCSLSMPILVSPPRGIGAFLISPLLDIGTYHLLDLHILVLVLSICAQIPSKSASLVRRLQVHEGDNVCEDVPGNPKKILQIFSQHHSSCCWFSCTQI
ncbi:uncharacterized protein LOC110026887 isoform X2 [Phalaenopsis equestris]|uniref:uncharacterized protein LOC110026887 isoform X2 n=1 Tax=Phalaenopsis equestris TaxID=78828 RepID=UPI0009E55FA4|nr:uncharacterized protein LOC110026887 isoform X2 [Phalaenopsis equestris]XP_020583737.1 uncharacterized protein LOC110026887 isoform X2 [Phalaenopsis equestris]XP_020583739.1 uncharacterized protein LOC110026887 isoform X2 [Phalaenopsis equestris]